MPLSREHLEPLLGDSDALGRLVGVTGRFVKLEESLPVIDRKRQKRRAELDGESLSFPAFLKKGFHALPRPRSILVVLGRDPAPDPVGRRGSVHFVLEFYPLAQAPGEPGVLGLLFVFFRPPVAVENGLDGQEGKDVVIHRDQFPPESGAVPRFDLLLLILDRLRQGGKGELKERLSDLGIGKPRRCIGFSERLDGSDDAQGLNFEFEKLLFLDFGHEGGILTWARPKVDA